MFIETFKCATGSGWGILVDRLVNCDIPYARTEQGAVENCLKVYPWACVITTDYPQHYSNEGHSE